MVENLRIRVPFVRTADNLADFFTKPLPPTAFVQMRDAIMNVPASQSPPVHADHEGVLKSVVSPPPGGESARSRACASDTGRPATRV